jgi:hypothetical protein
MDLQSIAEIAYLAGYFDGEGTVVIGKSMYQSKKHGPQSYHSLRIQVASTDIVSIREFERVFGGYVQYHETKRPGQWKSRWDWCACAHEATAALQQMLPHLKVKRHDAEVGIAFQRLMSAGIGGKPITQEIRDAREGLRLKLIHAHGVSSRSAELAGYGRPVGVVEKQPRRVQYVKKTSAAQAG